MWPNVVRVRTNWSISPFTGHKKSYWTWNLVTLAQILSSFLILLSNVLIIFCVKYPLYHTVFLFVSAFVGGLVDGIDGEKGTISFSGRPQRPAWKASTPPAWRPHCLPHQLAIQLQICQVSSKSLVGNRILWCFPEVTPVSDLLCFVFVAFSLPFDLFFIWHWTWAVGLYCCHLLSLTIVIIAVICPRSNQLSMFVNLINIPLDMGRQRTSRSKGGIEIIIMLHSEAEAACQEKLFLHLIFLHLI